MGFGNSKKNDVFINTTLEVQSHIEEQQTVTPSHTPNCLQEIEILNSNSKPNFNGTIFGESPLEKFNIVDKRCLSNERQVIKHKPILVDQEKAFQSNISFKPHQFFSFSHETTSHGTPVIQPLQTFNAPTFSSVLCTSSNLNVSPARDSPLITKADLKSTSYTLKSKSNKASECHVICSKALKYAKIVQDKKSISKNKERDTEWILGRIKKKGKSKARKNKIEYEGDDDQLCSLSQGNYENDESVSMYSLGTSLGVTLDGKPACSKNDVFSDFLFDLSNNEIPLPLL